MCPETHVLRGAEDRKALQACGILRLRGQPRKKEAQGLVGDKGSKTGQPLAGAHRGLSSVRQPIQALLPQPK